MSNLENLDQTLPSSYKNQVGPGIAGKGTVTILTGGRPGVLYYSPQDESRARVLYTINSIHADTPLPVRQDFQIPGGSASVFITYDVVPGGDIQIGWSLG